MDSMSGSSAFHPSPTKSPPRGTWWRLRTFRTPFSKTSRGSASRQNDWSAGSGVDHQVAQSSPNIATCVVLCPRDHSPFPTTRAIRRPRSRHGSRRTLSGLNNCGLCGGCFLAKAENPVWLVALPQHPAALAVRAAEPSVDAAGRNGRLTTHQAMPKLWVKMARVMLTSSWVKAASRSWSSGEASGQGL